jgi:integrase
MVARHGPIRPLAPWRPRIPPGHRDICARFLYKNEPSLVQWRHDRYETGMRRGEIQFLTWNKVDLKAGLIRLEGKDTKTGEGRSVPISLALREVLDAIR